MQSAAELYAQSKSDLWIETVSGKRFLFADPQFDIEDIAHALSMQCRYTGHCRKFFSVAEHSMLVAAIMLELDLGDPREGLLHDATEAYLSDIAAPWKVLLPDYRRIELELEGKLRSWAGLPAIITPGCKRADWIALLFEAYHLIPSRAKDWNCPEGIRDDVTKIIARHFRIQSLPPAHASWEFLALHREMERIRVAAP